MPDSMMTTWHICSQNGWFCCSLQPEPFFLFAHRAFFDGFGEALFLWTLLAAGGAAGLAAIEGKGGLAVVQHGAELLAADAEEGREAFELAFAKAYQFDGAILKFFPHVDAKAQSPGRVRHTEAALHAQFAQAGRHRRAAEDALQGCLAGVLGHGRDGSVQGVR